MDEEAAALEREFEAARSGADADAAAAARRDRAARERAKGLAVKNQRALWERMLELRILLQGCLQVTVSSDLLVNVGRACEVFKEWLKVRITFL